jgi:hypothetical protein
VKRWLLRIAIALAIAAATASAGIFWVLRPPAGLAMPPRGATLDGVTVIEPGRGRAEGRRVVVENGVIASVEAARGDGGPWQGLYVTPGLVDMHVHFPPASLAGQTELFAFLFLAHGVVAVRDAGDVDGTSSEPALRGIAEERFPGPRVQACGPFVDGDPPLWKNSLVARTPDEGRRAVETLASRGYGCVKAYNGLDVATLDAVRETAHARGLPVIGHVPRRVPYELARLDDAQHLIGIPPPDPDRGRLFPFTLEQWELLDDARLTALVDAMLRQRIANTPTLITIDRLFHTRDYARMLREPDVLLLPRFYREVVWNPEGGMSPAAGLGAGEFAMIGRALDVMKRTVKRLHDSGVRLHTGTDSLIAFVVPGASLHRELRLFVDAGLTPEEALAVSTRDSAADLGVPGLGTIAPGAPADLVVFREDPTRSLDALDSIAAVIRDGRLYTREALDAQLVRYRAHYDGVAYDSVATPLVRRALANTRK